MLLWVVLKRAHCDSLMWPWKGPFYFCWCYGNLSSRCIRVYLGGLFSTLSVEPGVSLEAYDSPCLVEGLAEFSEMCSFLEMAARCWRLCSGVSLAFPNLRSPTGWPDWWCDSRAERLGPCSQPRTGHHDVPGWMVLSECLRMCPRVTWQR